MNPPPAPIIRRVTPADAAAALSWAPEADALRRWAGPSTRHPTTPESLWEDINNGDATTFTLVSPSDGLVAFGQVCFRKQTCGHLARLIVSPQQRDRGLGRLLCLTLMREAVRLHPLKAFSLYVSPDNLNAIGLYRSLGYVEVGRHSQVDCLLMEAPRSAAPAE